MKTQNRRPSGTDEAQEEAGPARIACGPRAGPDAPERFPGDAEFARADGPGTADRRCLIGEQVLHLDLTAFDRCVEDQRERAEASEDADRGGAIVDADANVRLGGFVAAAGARAWERRHRRGSAGEARGDDERNVADRRYDGQLHPASHDRWRGLPDGLSAMPL